MTRSPAEFALATLAHGAICVSPFAWFLVCVVVFDELVAAFLPLDGATRARFQSQITSAESEAPAGFAALLSGLGGATSAATTADGEPKLLTQLKSVECDAGDAELMCAIRKL